MISTELMHGLHYHRNLYVFIKYQTCEAREDHLFPANGLDKIILQFRWFRFITRECLDDCLIRDHAKFTMYGQRLDRFANYFSIWPPER